MGPVLLTDHPKSESDKSMVEDLIILGAGGFGREASLLVEEINAVRQTGQYNLLGFIDDDKAKWGSKLRDYPVLGGTAYLHDVERDIRMIAAIGDPLLKKSIVDKVSAYGFEFCSLVHPDLSTAGEVEIGRGSLLNKGCLMTVNIKIGRHVSINPGCGIGHDSVIGDYSTLMWRVNISGNVKIGKGCLLGTGATVLQGLNIGDGVTIGAGAVVTKDLPAHCTAVGVPARIVKESPSP